MPKSTYARDGDPFAGLRLCFFDAFVSCDSGADDWRCIHRSKAVRYMCDIIWICQKVLGESSILGIAAKLCFSADCLPGLRSDFGQLHPFPVDEEKAQFIGPFLPPANDLRVAFLLVKLRDVLDRSPACDVPFFALAKH